MRKAAQTAILIERLGQKWLVWGLQVCALAFVTSVADGTAIAVEFGSNGQNGQIGPTGNAGRSGFSLAVKATGQSASYDASGQDGGTGGSGQPGFSAGSCIEPVRPNYNLNGANGGYGGQGGYGGNGGKGGALTVYYTDINNLKLLTVRGTPGQGGNPGWGGRGGEPCECGERQWSVGTGTQAHTYTCLDGLRGSDGAAGQRGSYGGYGQVMLIGQMDPIKADQPQVTVDMGSMLSGPFTLSKNHWEVRQGAAELFASGTDIADNYYLYKGRTEVEYVFSWQATRPVSDFSGWQMSLQLDEQSNDAQLYLPGSLWFDSQKIVDGNKRKFVFLNAVSTGEIGNIQIGDISGDGPNHIVSVQDNARVSDVLKTSVHMQYFTAENGQWQLRFDGAVPPESLRFSGGGFQILMSTLGIKAEYLTVGTEADLNLTVTRALGKNSAAYTLGTSYFITLHLVIGDTVAAIADADTYSSSTPVGHVTKGDKFKVKAIQGDWIQLVKPDGTAVPGWIKIVDLERSSL